MMSMKRLVVLFALVIMASLTLGLLAFMPYHFYYVALETGLDSRFLKVGQIPPSLLRGKDLNVENVTSKSLDSANRWHNFQVRDYILPLPLKHPYYLFIPQISLDEQKRPQIGWDLNNQNRQSEVKIRYLEPITYEYPFKDNLLFNLPIFRNYLLKVPTEKIWKDLFMLELTLPDSKVLGTFGWLRQLWRMPYTELAYRLFILKTRQAIFPRNVAALYFDARNEMGVIEIIPTNTNESQIDNSRLVEHTYILREGLIQRLEITTKRYSLAASAYRHRFYEALKWKPSNPDITVEIYNDFNKLSFEQKVDQEGMTYLFAGWSHVPKQEDFLRTMIQFLERGPQNQVHLKSLYQYAYDLFGTSFSNSKEFLRETEERKLERKISEELKGEIEEVKNSKVQVQDGSFQNDNDKIDFYLKKAKEQGSSNESNMLVE